MTSPTTAIVHQIIPLTDSILQLHLVPDTYIDYQAGQYLQLLCGEEALSYSIANAPLGSHHYELHIRHQQGNPYTQPLFADMKQRGKVSLLMPFGTCHVDCLDKTKPIIFIAGGTGFAPIKAIIEYLLATGDNRPFSLYWGARALSDLYMDEQVKHWQNHVNQFHYVSQISDNHTIRLLVQKIIVENNLTSCQAVIAGPFDMAFTVKDQLVNAGMQPEAIFSDAFSFEK